MRQPVHATPVAIWVALCTLTVVSVLVVEGGWWRSVAPVLIVLIAAVKSRMVILHYMEARHARPHWRFLYEAWNFAAAATLIIGGLMS
jgi:Prokaryotic Cytochrome C oxidase subunit IV